MLLHSGYGTSGVENYLLLIVALYLLGWHSIIYLMNIFFLSLPAMLSKVVFFLKWCIWLVQPPPKNMYRSNLWILKLFTIWCLDNEADEQQQSEPQMQHLSANGISHAGIGTQNVQYATPPQLGTGHAVVWTSHFNGPSYHCLSKQYMFWFAILSALIGAGISVNA